jgi:polyhydroxybutyrate depolymerase
VAVLEIHGTADTVVPYGGRGARHAGSVRAYLRGWVARDRCPDAVRRRRVNRRVLRLDWRPCAAGTAVAHLRLSGTTHGWPGGRGPFPRRDPSRISADRAVWEFFRGRTLAPPG